jgi:hypothetical protein
METPQKKPEEGAPAYMAQYTALMTILLAFFICMMSAGMNRVSKYKTEGLGYIRDAFGAKGGMGIMPFVRKLLGGFPKVEKESEGEGDLLGYVKGTFESEVFSANGIIKSEVLDLGNDIRIRTPVRFGARGDFSLDKTAREFLDRLGGVFLSLPDLALSINCLVSSGNEAEDEVIAAQRAVVIVRHLREYCGIPSERVRGAGYAHSRFLGMEGAAGAEQAVVIVVRKMKSARKG